MTVSSTLEPVVVRGDPGLLERLAGNLVENAIRHNATGGTAAISVSSSNKSGEAVLEVDNTGPVLEPASVDGLVEPFRRAGPDRASNDGGVGLGLSIVNAVVTAHHGTMTLEARQKGGLQVRAAARSPSYPPTRPSHRNPLPTCDTKPSPLDRPENGSRSGRRAENGRDPSKRSSKSIAYFRVNGMARHHSIECWPSRTQAYSGGSATAPRGRTSRGLSRGKYRPK